MPTDIIEIQPLPLKLNSESRVLLCLFVNQLFFHQHELLQSLSRKTSVQSQNYVGIPTGLGRALIILNTSPTPILHLLVEVLSPSGQYFGGHDVVAWVLMGMGYIIVSIVHVDENRQRFCKDFFISTVWDRLFPPPSLKSYRRDQHQSWFALAQTNNQSFSGTSILEYYSYWNQAGTYYFVTC